MTVAYSPSHGPPALASRSRRRYAAVWTASSASSGAGRGSMRASTAGQRAALYQVVRLLGQHGLGDIHAAQSEGLAGDLHRGRRRIVGEDAGRVGVAQHDAAMLTMGFVFSQLRLALTEPPGDSRIDLTATLQHDTQVEDAAAAIATREPLTSGFESRAMVARAAGNRAFARMALDAGRRPARAVLAPCSCGAPAAGGGTCAACASEEEFVPQLDALRGAVARRTLARVCAPAADCATPDGLAHRVRPADRGQARERLEGREAASRLRRRKAGVHDRWPTPRWRPR